MKSKYSLHLFGLVAFLSFFMLLSLHFGLFQGRVTPLRLKTISAPEETSWVIFQGSKKIGYAKRRIQQENTIRFEEEIFLNITTMGHPQPVTLKVKGNSDYDLNLLSFDFLAQTGVFNFHITGNVQGKKLIYRAGPIGEEKEGERNLLRPINFTSLFTQRTLFDGLREGKRRSIRALDPLTLTERELEITYGGKEEILLSSGEKRITKKYVLYFQGLTQYAWTDEEGNLLKEEIPGGFTFEKVAKIEPHDTPAASVDFSFLTSLAADKKLENPARLTKLIVTLKNIEYGRFYLDGGRQVFRPPVLTISKESLSSINKTKPTETTSALLQASPFIQADHPLIREKARELTRDVTSDMEKAKKILNWVYEKVEKKPTLSLPNALETLKNLKGDCNEHAVLAAALLRAVEIPTDTEAGLVYMNGRFYYHAWNVLHLGRWITADAALGQFPADVTHIRLIRGGIEKQGDLVALLGKLTIEIVTAY